MLKAFYGHKSNVFCVIFDHDNSHIFSCASDSKIYRYDIEKSPQMNSTTPQSHDFLRNDSCDEYSHHDGLLYKLSLSATQPNLLASASDTGKCIIFDIRSGEKEMSVSCLDIFTSVEFHPFEGHRFITTSSDSGLQEWDLRYLQEFKMNPKACTEYDSLGFNNICGASYSNDGRRIAAAAVRSFPMLFNVGEKKPQYVFHDPNYRNCCTLKSVTFGINDEYIVTGSDDFCGYIWNIPKGMNETRAIEGEDVDVPTMKRYSVSTLHKVLEEPETDCVLSADQVLVGHRSIVNNVISHPTYPLLCSAGVEKILKFWSPYPIHPDQKEVPPKPRKREALTHENFTINFDTAARAQDNDDTTEESPSTLLLFDYFNILEQSDGDSDMEMDDYDSSSSSSIEEVEQMEQEE